MPTSSDPGEGGIDIVVCHIQGRRCAIQLRDVLETLPLLPIDPIARPDAAVVGVARWRGAAVPVVDLAAALGGSFPTDAGAMIAVAVGTRRVLLLVDSIDGLHALPPTSFADLPPLLRGAHQGTLAALGELDAGFLAVIEAARLIDGGVHPGDEVA